MADVWYLGAVIGSQEYVEEYVSSKVRAWSSSINVLSDIAKSQPQAAFSALTHGLLNKWTLTQQKCWRLRQSVLALSRARFWMGWQNNRRL